jgi:polyisoprenoid-binding protein YceI
VSSLADPRDGELASILQAAGSWRLDPAATTVTLSTRAMYGLVRVKGRLAALDGHGSVDAAGEVSGTLTISSASIDTGNKRRDEHLRSVQFFNADDYPEITYALSGASMAADGQVRVSGSLTVRRRSEPLDLLVTVRALGQDRIVATTSVTVDRSRWGISWASGGARLATDVQVNAEFVRQ